MIEKIKRICAEKGVNIGHEYAKRKVSNCLSVLEFLGFCASEDHDIVFKREQPKKACGYKSLEEAEIIRENIRKRQ